MMAKTEEAQKSTIVSVVRINIYDEKWMENGISHYCIKLQKRLTGSDNIHAVRLNWIRIYYLHILTLNPKGNYFLETTNILKVLSFVEAVVVIVVVAVSSFYV